MAMGLYRWSGPYSHSNWFARYRSRIWGLPWWTCLPRSRTRGRIPRGCKLSRAWASPSPSSSWASGQATLETWKTWSLGTAECNLQGFQAGSRVTVGRQRGRRRSCWPGRGSQSGRRDPTWGTCRRRAHYGRSWYRGWWPRGQLRGRVGRAIVGRACKACPQSGVRWPARPRHWPSSPSTWWCWTPQIWQLHRLRPQRPLYPGWWTSPVRRLIARWRILLLARQVVAGTAGTLPDSAGLLPCRIGFGWNSQSQLVWNYWKLIKPNANDKRLISYVNWSNGSFL